VIVCPRAASERNGTRLEVTPSPRTAGALCVLLAAAAVWLAFGPTLDGGFFMDDHYFLKEIHARGGVERTTKGHPQ